MRKLTEFSTEDNHIIYGTLDTNNNRTLIIFVHGFTGNQNEHHFFNAAPFFLGYGFDTFRFDLYSGNKNGRSLSRCSLTDHSNDLDLVIDHFKDMYDSLTIVGHSLGALVLLKSDLTPVSKIVLWDPSNPFKQLKRLNIKYDPHINNYLVKGKMDFYVGKKLIDEWMNFDLELMLHKLTTPCKIIFAGNYNKHELWKPYLDKISAEHECVKIENATHVFVEEGTEQKLFEETLQWIVEK